jgi:hypothetical protein
MEYEGWKNYSTWNVSFWLNNDEPIYQAAVEFMKDYKGKMPYKAFVTDSGLDTQKTLDRVQWLSKQLDFRELNAMMFELAPEGARNV